MLQLGRILCVWWSLLAALGAEATPVAVLLSENGAAPTEEFVLSAGDEYTGAAPLEWRFMADESGESQPNARYEWQFARDASFSDIFLTRFEAETIYSFTEAGTFFVRLLTTDQEMGDTTESDVFTVRVSESELKVPNAFSPNGDGVHDVFRVTHRSLVSFRATVFNRWGQELYSWNLSHIDAGWDGTAHGRPVPEGVYFIVVEAKGADGIDYRIKQDINILR